MKKSLGAKTIVYPTPGFYRGHLRQGWKAKCDERGVGRALLLQSAKCCDFSQEGNLYVRKYCGTEGIHNKHPL